MKKHITAAALLTALALTLSACGASASAASEKSAESVDATTAATEATEEAPSSALDTILSAGTTQAFADEALPREDVETILRAGLAAESAINQQPWFLAAVTDKDLLAELSSSAAMPQGMGKPETDGERPTPPQGVELPGSDGERPTPPEGVELPAVDSAKPMAPQGGNLSAQQSGAKASLGDSPLAIIVYQDPNTASPNADFDCGLATQNMYLAAVSLGYGAKIVSSPTMTLNGTDHDSICEKLGVDPSYTAVAVLLVGKADESVDGVTGASVRAGLEEKTVIR